MAGAAVREEAWPVNRNDAIGPGDRVLTFDGVALGRVAAVTADSIVVDRRRGLSRTRFVVPRRAVVEKPDEHAVIVLIAPELLGDAA